MASSREHSSLGPAFYDTDDGPDLYPRYSRQIEIVAKVYKQRP